MDKRGESTGDGEWKVWLKSDLVCFPFFLFLFPISLVDLFLVQQSSILVCACVRACRMDLFVLHFDLDLTPFATGRSKSEWVCAKRRGF